jgi:hypothetical protein
MSQVRFPDIRGSEGQYIGLTSGATASNDRRLVFCVNRRLNNHDRETTLLIVVGSLDKRIALAAVHCAILKMQFCHVSSPSWFYYNLAEMQMLL